MIRSLDEEALKSPLIFPDRLEINHDIWTLTVIGELFIAVDKVLKDQSEIECQNVLTSEKSLSYRLKQIFDSQTENKYDYLSEYELLRNAKYFCNWLSFPLDLSKDQLSSSTVSEETLSQLDLNVSHENTQSLEIDNNERGDVAIMIEEEIGEKRGIFPVPWKQVLMDPQKYLLRPDRGEIKPQKMLTAVDWAFLVLCRENRSMKYSELADLCLKERLFVSKAQRPGQTLGKPISKEIEKFGVNARFVKRKRTIHLSPSAISNIQVISSTQLYLPLSEKEPSISVLLPFQIFK